MKNRSELSRLCFAALGTTINIACAFIAMNLHLPIFMDSVGTILVSTVLGAKYGVISGVMGSIISGITFDIYSLYYFPVQIFTALMTGLLTGTKWLSGWRFPLGSLAVSLPTALASSLVTAFVFGGFTSSSNSYVIALLHSMGMNLTLSCFIIQILTEYLDKSVALILVKAAIKKGVCAPYGKIQQNNK